MEQIVPSLNIAKWKSYLDWSLKIQVSIDKVMKPQYRKKLVGFEYMWLYSVGFFYRTVTNIFYYVTLPHLKAKRDLCSDNTWSKNTNLESSKK